MVLNRDFRFNTFFLSFLAGVSCFGEFCFDSLMFYILQLALLCWVVWHRDLLKKAEIWRPLALLILLGFLLGVGRAWLDYRPLPPGIGLHVQMLGRVAALPDKKGMNQEVILESAEPGKAAVRVLAVFAVQENISYGDRIIFSGKRQDVSALDAVMQSNLFRRRIDCYVQQAALLKKVGQGDFLDPVGLIFRWRQVFLDALSRTLSEPAASLVAGILIGERGNIPVAVSQDFQTTGLTHILAISGFNITLIINLIIFFSGSWKKGRRFVFSLVMILIFVVMTGAGASVVRAGVMGVLMLFCKTLGRRVKAFRVVLLSAFLIVFNDPRLLNLDLSFQLSVMATMSLVCFSESLEFTCPLKWQEMIREGVTTTLAAQILTLPLMFYSFGRISLISPLANLLIGPVIPVLMFLGALQLAAALLLQPLAIMLASLCELVVQVMLTVIGFLAKIPLAQLEVGQGQIWLAVLYYLGIYFIFRKRRPAQN